MFVQLKITSSSVVSSDIVYAFSMCCSYSSDNKKYMEHSQSTVCV